MPSPFPGMDPYLEDSRLWPTFHHQIVTSLYQTILPGLVDRYKARVAQWRYVTEQPLFTSIVREEHHEEFLEIQQRKDSRTVTIVDVVTPHNKLTEQGRRGYLEKRLEGRRSAAGLIEIDLLLEGVPLLDYSRDGLPDWDYVVTVSRSNQPNRYEVYTTTLQKGLPRFRLPLATDDRDTIIDLQAVFQRGYEQGGFAQKIDYARDPSTRLRDEDRRWIDAHLRLAKLRS